MKKSATLAIIGTTTLAGVLALAYLVYDHTHISRPVRSCLSSLISNPEVTDEQVRSTLAEVRGYASTSRDWQLVNALANSIENADKAGSLSYQSGYESAQSFDKLYETGHKEDAYALSNADPEVVRLRNAACSAQLRSLSDVALIGDAVGTPATLKPSAQQAWLSLGFTGSPTACNVMTASK
jgi:hypothetical protein